MCRSAIEESEMVESYPLPVVRFLKLLSGVVTVVRFVSSCQMRFGKGFHVCYLLSSVLTIVMFAESFQVC